MVSEYYDYGNKINLTTRFIVKNIAPGNKTIKIFHYPILNGQTRDLIKIPGVDEADIRHSLLKGELYRKLDCEEAVIIDTDIDLLQFDDPQKQFLILHGANNGLSVGASQLAVIRKDDVHLIGNVDGVNTVYRIPDPSWIQNSTYKIIVYLNGVKQFYLDDYFIAESGGPGTGYNTVIFTVAPESAVAPPDVITADYYINNV